MEKFGEVQKQINEQSVIQSELKQLKPKAKVYHQQQNSNIFFLSSKDKEMCRAKETLDSLRKEYEEAAKLTTVQTVEENSGVEFKET